MWVSFTLRSISDDLLYLQISPLEPIHLPLVRHALHWRTRIVEWWSRRGAPESYAYNRGRHRLLDLGRPPRPSLSCLPSSPCSQGTRGGPKLATSRIARACRRSLAGRHGAGGCLMGCLMGCLACRRGVEGFPCIISFPLLDLYPPHGTIVLMHYQRSRCII